MNKYDLADGVLDHHPALTWYVARAATRQEARAERSMTHAKVAFYIPKLTTWGGPPLHRVKVHPSLFEGYGFIGLARGQSFYELNVLEGVHGVIRFGEGVQPRPARFSLIASIAEAQLAGHFDRTLDVAPEELFERDEIVRVVDGKFRGFNANFLRMRARQRVEVLITIFGRPTSVELDAADLRKLA